MLFVPTGPVGKEDWFIVVFRAQSRLLSFKKTYLTCS